MADEAAGLRHEDPESNSLAIIVQHMAGNLRSRFADFLRAARTRLATAACAPPAAAFARIHMG